MTPSLFRCPICGNALRREADAAGRPRALRCAKGHCFDFAREGYAHLLPASRMRAKVPGDSREMVAARRAFLDGGGYGPFARALAALCLEATDGIPCPAVLDAGCGEGYYTRALADAFAQAGRPVRLAAYDISKAAVRATVRAEGPQVQQLFSMTPYYWKTPRAGAARLAALDALTCEAQFDFLVYQKL